MDACFDQPMFFMVFALVYDVPYNEGASSDTITWQFNFKNCWLQLRMEVKLCELCTNQQMLCVVTQCETCFLEKCLNWKSCVGYMRMDCVQNHGFQQSSNVFGFVTWTLWEQSNTSCRASPVLGLTPIRNVNICVSVYMCIYMYRVPPKPNSDGPFNRFWAF